MEWNLWNHKPKHIPPHSGLFPWVPDQGTKVDKDATIFMSFCHPTFHRFSQSTQNRRLRQKLKEKDQSLEDVDSEQWREEIFEGGKVSCRLNHCVKSVWQKTRGINISLFKVQSKICCFPADQGWAVKQWQPLEHVLSSLRKRPMKRWPCSLHHACLNL